MRDVILDYLHVTWRALLRTALAAIVPFIPVLIAVPVDSQALLAALFTVALAVVLAAATALISIPDLSGESWSVVALAKALRQFGQMVVAGIGTATLITDVEWPTILLGALASAVSTLILAAIDTLPALAAPQYEFLDPVGDIVTTEDV